MRPVYGLIKTAEETVVHLFYERLKPSRNVPLKDHFTVVYTLVPASTILPSNVHKMWRENNLDDSQM